MQAMAAAPSGPTRNRDHGLPGLADVVYAIDTNREFVRSLTVCCLH